MRAQYDREIRHNEYKQSSSKSKALIKKHIIMKTIVTINIVMKVDRFVIQICFPKKIVDDFSLKEYCILCISVM